MHFVAITFCRSITPLYLSLDGIPSSSGMNIDYKLAWMLKN